MCLKGPEVPKEQHRATIASQSKHVQSLIDQGFLDSEVKDLKEFFIYKIVRRSEEVVEGKKKKILHSPIRPEDCWEPGERFAKGNVGDGHAGIYGFLGKPSAMMVAKTGYAILRMTVHVDDITAMGPDMIDTHEKGLGGNFEGTCVVARKVKVSNEDFKAALSGKRSTMEAAAIMRETKKLLRNAAAKIKTTKKKVKKTISATSKTVRKRVSDAKKKAKTYRKK